MAFPTFLFPYGQDITKPVPVVYLCKSNPHLKRWIAGIATPNAMYTLWSANPAGLHCERVVVVANPYDVAQKVIDDINRTWRTRLDPSHQAELYWVG